MAPESRGENKGSAPSTAGRPRDSRIDTAIIAATRELIVETGYPALSLSAIAARAGTTTAAIYRRWSGKTQLVHEAVLSADSVPAADGSDDIHDEIRAVVETVRAMFDKPYVRVALPGLIADTVADHDVHAMMISRLAGNLTAFESRFGRGRRPDDRLPMLAEVVAGTVIVRLLIRQDAILDDAWVEEMTRMITDPWTQTRPDTDQT
ncbi:MAG: TetR-like C-terminal domain-containing protein [Corynebacteriales bacterium]|nr:TetR-like C-terminal domain-containing protein [Mycobacteriales bacterium]